MKMSEIKEKLAEILPEGVTLPDEVLEKVAGGLSLDSTGEALISALARVGIDLSPEKLKDSPFVVGVSKPQGGGLGTTKPTNS